MSQNKYLIQGTKPVLPAKSSEWVRVIDPQPKLVDAVDQAIAAVNDRLDGEFSGLLTGGQKGEYVHGSRKMDDAVAAIEIKKELEAMGVRVAAGKNLAQIGVSMAFAMRRFGASRKQLIEKRRVLASHVGGGDGIGESDAD